MIYQDGDYIAVHSEPIWRDRSNFIFRVPIKSDEREQRWEQLWWKKITETQFSLCCIPFFAYDLALGDEVEVDAQYRIVAITNPSGQLTYRIWFGGVSSSERDLALESIAERSPIMEWSSADLLAVSVSTVDAQPMADTLQRLQNEGSLQYEAGRT